jgi:hypothetical protein
VHQCVLQYEATLKGVKHTFSSEVLYVEYTTLLFRMDAEKTATIYYNPYDPAEYCFDVSNLKGN